MHREASEARLGWTRTEEGGGQLKIKKKDAEVGTGSVEVHSEIY